MEDEQPEGGGSEAQAPPPPPPREVTCTGGLTLPRRGAGES